MIRVYTASKLKHAQMWRDLSKQWNRVFFHARWLKHTEIGTPDAKEHAGRFWMEDEADVKVADAVLVYAAPEDHLRGALVEAGMAIAYTIPVIVVGSHPDYGTWQHHPCVRHAADLTIAYAMLKIIDDARFASHG